jgi:chromosomal replication initiator protein
MLAPRDAWQAALGQLQLQLNRATFDTWLKGSEVVAYEDGEFIVRVRHAYAKDWLEKHLNHLIIQTLGRIFGRSVKINYVIHLPHRSVPGGVGSLWEGLPDSTPQNAGIEVADKLRAAAQSVPDEELEEGCEANPSDEFEWAPRAPEITRRTSTHLLAEASTPLNQHQTFDSFVVGPNSEFAFAAAHTVAQSPGAPYNPLMLYGGVGLGKTHLLHATGHACEANGLDVVYATAEAFTNEMIVAIRAHTMAEFRARYRSADVLLVDDIHFLAGKTSSEEEFYHTINAIFSHNGQLVLAGDRAPRSMSALDERLRSRFEGGLQADIQPPELETRVAILEAKSAAQGTPLPREVADLLARHVTANVRELEGALTQVLARATLAGQPLTVTLAQFVLNKHGVQVRRHTNLDDVLEAAATYHQLSMDDLISKRRTREVTRARHVAIYLAREETDASLPQIGEALGGRNHSTVLHGYQKIADEIEADDGLREEINAIRRQLHLLPNH